MKAKILTLFVLLILSVSMVSADLMSIQGQVTDTDGNPVEDGLFLEVTIYDAPIAGNLVYFSDTDFESAIINGRYDVVLGSVEPLNLVYGQEYYLDIAVGGQSLMFDGQDRQKFQSNVGDINVLNNRGSNGGTGSNSISGGQDSDADGDNSIGYGTNAEADGDNSFALGYYTIAGYDSAFAIGNATEASGFASFASGHDTTASGDLSFVIGVDTIASGIGSFAGGELSEASGPGSFAFGYTNEATSEGSFAIGEDNIASGNYSFVIGSNNLASGHISFAGGELSKATGVSSFAFGNENIASGQGSFAYGTQMNVSGQNSVGFGLDDPLNSYDITTDSVMAIMGGDVGIGTTNPRATLEINGTVLVETDEDNSAEGILVRNYAFGHSKLGASALTLYEGDESGSNRASIIFQSTTLDTTPGYSISLNKNTDSLEFVNSYNPTAGLPAMNIDRDSNVNIEKILRLTPHDSPGSCDQVNRGSVYFSSDKNFLCFCDGSGWVAVDDKSEPCVVI